MAGRMREAGFDVVHMRNFLPKTLYHDIAPENPRYFIYLGRLVREKGIETLIKAYAKASPEPELRIIGDGKIKTELEQLILSLGMYRKIRLFGAKYGDELAAQIAGSLALIQPSEIMENCPYSIMEALSMGKPVIGSHIGGIPELIYEDVTGFCYSMGSVDELAKKLSIMSDMPVSKYSAMSKACKDFAARNFSMKKYVNELVSRYETLICSIRLSFVVPVYNVARYISQCVESLMNSAYGNIEIILVDDGSTDGGADICERFAAKYPDIVRVIHQPNLGLGSARNSGLDAARGDYIVFIDGDDYVVQGMAAIVAKNLKALNFPDMLIYNIRWVGESGNIIRTGSENSNNPLIAKPSACNRAIRKTVFIKSGIRFPTGKAHFEDLRTTPKLAAYCANVEFIPDVLYNYRVREGSIMNGSDFDRKADILQAFDDLMQWFDGKSEIEYLAVYHVLYSASIDVLKAVPFHPVLEKLRAYVLENFPDYHKNPYIRSNLSMRKRLTIALLCAGIYRPLYLAYRLLRKPRKTSRSAKPRTQPF
jgi:glycosyltransferase involved in cell wall biosynthesis